MNVMLYDVLYT